MWTMLLYFVDFGSCNCCVFVRTLQNHSSFLVALNLWSNSPSKMRFLIPFGQTQTPVNLFCLTCLIDWKVETVWQDLPPKCSPSRQHWLRAVGPPRSLGWLLRHPKTEKWPSTGNIVLLVEFYCFRITFVSIWFRQNLIRIYPANCSNWLFNDGIWRQRFIVPLQLDSSFITMVKISRIKLKGNNK